MEKPFLLHMITSEKNTSPFDANMAFDAGWDSIIPYTDVAWMRFRLLSKIQYFPDLPQR